MTDAIIFPGQGAQFEGMGKAWADHSLAAAGVFKDAAFKAQVEEISIHAVRLSRISLHIDSLLPAILNHLFSAWKL